MKIKKMNRNRVKSTYSVLVNDINNNNKLSVIFAIVDKRNSPDLNVSLERLQSSHTNIRIYILTYTHVYM